MPAPSLCWRCSITTLRLCAHCLKPAGWTFVSLPATGDMELVTFLLPQPAASHVKYSLSKIETVGGKAFEITSENGLDIVMIRDRQGAGRVETERLASDFEWSWASFSNREDEVPKEFLLIDGQTLQLDGNE